MQDLIQIYREKLNLSDAIFERIEHDDAIVAIVYKVILPDGKNYILKISQLSEIHYFRELYGLQKFVNVLPVAKIIKTVAPDQSVHGAILMECLSGSIGSVKNLTEDVAYQMGMYLAKIHTFRTAGYGEVVDPNNLSNDPFSYFATKLHERSLDCEKYIPKKLLTMVDVYFQEHKKLLETVDGPCIIHRDFRPGNILIDRGKISGIIDWAGMYSAFAEEDFLYLEHHHGSPMADVCKQTFLKGYATVRSVPDYQKVLPLLRLNKAIGTLKFIIKTDTVHGRNAQLFQYNYDFLKNFFGV